MSDPSLVLVVGNDVSLAVAKTSRHLCRALSRLGHGAVCRDTRLVRWAIAEVGKVSAARRDAYEQGVVAKWNKFVYDYGFGTVVSLSTISRLSARRPLCSLGRTCTRRSEASVGSVVNAQTVIESVASKRSSCNTTTGRGFPA